MSPRRLAGMREAMRSMRACAGRYAARRVVRTTPRPDACTSGRFRGGVPARGLCAAPPGPTPPHDSGLGPAHTMGGEPRRALRRGECAPPRRALRRGVRSAAAGPSLPRPSHPPCRECRPWSRRSPSARRRSAAARRLDRLRLARHGDLALGLRSGGRRRHAARDATSPARQARAAGREPRGAAARAREACTHARHVASTHATAMHARQAHDARTHAMHARNVRLHRKRALCVVRVRCARALRACVARVRCARAMCAGVCACVSLTAS